MPRTRRPYDIFDLPPIWLLTRPSRLPQLHGPHRPLAAALATARAAEAVRPTPSDLTR
ncbi:hypothetical protein ABZ960_17765 [Streptomyces pseudovenezuelae]|uniref:hypothetical protein n=1 Tax=Streptomyces pseudovenezuelae TaxID=67350 RepID=UPI0034A35EDF